MKKSLVVASLIILIACTNWKLVQGPLIVPEKNMAVNIPAGWHQFNKTKNFLLFTRDGLLLEFIKILRVPVTEKLKYTRKTLRRDMLPQEVSEVIIDNLRSNTSLLNLQILENKPVNIDSFPGFRLVYSFESKAQLKYKTVIYGFIRKSLYYQLKYEAASRHYFDKYLEDFEKVKDSFTILNKE